MGAHCRLLLLEATQRLLASFLKRIAAARGHTEIVGSLLEKGADINAVWGEHGTVLEIATKHGHNKIVPMLLERRARYLAAVLGICWATGQLLKYFVTRSAFSMSNYRKVGPGKAVAKYCKIQHSYVILCSGAEITVYGHVRPEGQRRLMHELLKIWGAHL
ncbi:hypothetical protein B0H13DRAFT_1866436 [Mycena leptocephala]|nr:hypothetical protein B0H13DRAFT_1866436 [Mycena leptocephala]